MKKSLLILPLILLTSALALTACGGGGSSSSAAGDEEAAIEETIETSATSTEPSKCTEFQTEEFNEQDQGVPAKEALSACKESAENDTSPAESVEVSNISIEDETATADAALTGSALNGQTVEVELAKEEGNWKLNQFLKFSKYDAAGLAEGVEQELEGAEGVSPSLAKCVAAGFAKASQGEAEELVFSGNSSGIEELAASCK
jgi:hypothetical protein